MSLKHQAFRIAKYAYNAVPEKSRGQVEALFAPITFRLATRGMIKKNESLGNPPYKPVSIVIPSYNDFRLLKKLIKSIEKTCSDFQYEIIISDDFCELENTKLLKTLESDRVQIIEGESRKGFAGAVNRGLAIARWDVVLLNSDIVALPFWLENLQAAAYNIDPKIGLVSPHLLYPTGRIQYGGTFHAKVVAPQWFAHLDQGRYANYPSANVGKYVVAISGACVYIKKEVLEVEPRFDEEYWLGFEDVDYAFTVRKHGFRAYIEPSSKLVHLESATRGKVQGAKEYASMRRFWEKWPWHEKNDFNIETLVLYLSSDSKNDLVSIASSMKNELNRAGYKAEICFTNPDQRIDEVALLRYKDSNYVHICLDFSSVETVWFVSENAGRSVLFIPDFAISGVSNSYLDPVQLSKLKPEFLYITGNEQNKKILSRYMPWKVENSVVLPPFRLKETDEMQAINSEKQKCFIAIKQNGEIPTELKITYELFDEVEIIDVNELIHSVEDRDCIFLNNVVILLDKQASNYLCSSLLRRGAILFCPEDDNTNNELMDGLNVYRFADPDGGLKAKLKNYASEQIIWNGITKGNLQFSNYLADKFVRELVSILEYSK